MSLRKAYYGRRAQGSQARASVKRRPTNSRFPRRTTQKRGSYLAPRYGVGRAYPSISSDRLKTCHKYSLALEISVASGVSTPYVFRGNSAYDPDFTSTGYNAMGFATLAALYGRYQVTHSSIRVRASSDTPCQVSLVPSLLSSTLSSSTEDYAENTYGKDILTAQGNVKEMYSSMSTSKMFGEIPAGSAFSAGITANPASPWYWHIKAGHIFGEGTATVNLVVDLVYYTEWSQRVSYSTRT